MIEDARTFSDGDDLEFDVCIIGSGPSGMSAALSLQGSGLRVVVLESGGLDEEPESDALQGGAMLGINTWTPDRWRVRRLGGTSRIWAGWCRPLGREDFEARDHVAHSGWPIGLDDLVPFYARAQERLDLGDFFYDPQAIAAAAGRPLVMAEREAISHEIYQYSPPTRFGDKYRSELQRSEDVRVILHANVVDVVLEDGLGRVDRVVASTLEGLRFTVRAGRFALACGGLENPRVLLNANSQIPEGIANGSDNVGRFFMEHPHYYGSSSWLVNGAPSWDAYERRRTDVDVDGARLAVDTRVVLGLSAQVREDEGLLRFGAELVPYDTLSDQTGPLGPGTIQALSRAESEQQGFVAMNLRCEQSPNPDSRVTLGDDVDALGLPQLNLNWQVGPNDDAQLKRAMELLGAELGAAGLGRLWAPTQEGRFTWNRQPGGHHMGTTRMSADPADGVVDANLRCHDVENLYVLGASVFTTGGDANPTLTAVALAERWADHIRETT